MTEPDILSEILSISAKEIDNNISMNIIEQSICRDGGIGRRGGLKIRSSARGVGVQLPLSAYQNGGNASRGGMLDQLV